MIDEPLHVDVRAVVVDVTVEALTAEHATSLASAWATRSGYGDGTIESAGRNPFDSTVWTVRIRLDEDDDEIEEEDV